VRGCGLLVGVEFVADRDSKRPFPAESRVANRAAEAAMAAGVVTYPCQGGGWASAGDALLLMPPFVTTDEELKVMVDRVAEGVRFVAAELLA
jgi:adenosylmethionine-8-amino-7-oxononanoate aminotransferase